MRLTPRSARLVSVPQIRQTGASWRTRRWRSPGFETQKVSVHPGRRLRPLATACRVGSERVAVFAFGDGGEEGEADEPVCGPDVAPEEGLEPEAGAEPVPAPESPESPGSEGGEMLAGGGGRLGGGGRRLGGGGSGAGGSGTVGSGAGGSGTVGRGAGGSGTVGRGAGGSAGSCATALGAKTPQMPSDARAAIARTLIDGLEPTGLLPAYPE